MKNIESIRNEINSIDEELVKLFKRRLEIVEEVAASKRESGAAVTDPARERAILSRVSAGSTPNRSAWSVIATPESPRARAARQIASRLSLESCEQCVCRCWSYAIIRGLSPFLSREGADHFPSGAKNALPTL